MTDFEKLEASCLKIRSVNPLVHCITNYVAMEFNADALLAVGASPLMSFCDEEIPEIASFALSLVVNTGCLDSFQIGAMKTAASQMNGNGRPWVLDPVGAGATALRTDTAVMLARDFHPSIIRGNASEIMSLALSFGNADSRSVRPKGVDSGNNSLEAVGPAELLAGKSGSVVSVSGEVDVITDGKRTVCVNGGDALMSRVTAMGCTASALTGAFLAVCDSPFEAALFAMTMMARAGERAARISRGPASMRMHFVDELYKFGR